MTKSMLMASYGWFLADGLVTHIERSLVDTGLAQRQWQAYVDALVDQGWQVVEAPPAETVTVPPVPSRSAGSR